MWLRTALVVTLAVTATAQERVGIGQLADLARARAQRQRPELERALQPFRADLSLDRDRNREVVDAAIDRVAALGTTLEPLLLELLAPEDAGTEAKHVASNVARVLAKLDTAGILDTLIEFADGDHALARREAVWLLARSDHPAALAALIRNFPRLTAPRTIEAALRAVAEQGSPALADVAQPHLANSDPGARGAALDYLAAIRDPRPLPQVVAALATETEDALLPSYVGYLERVAKGHAEAAAALLQLLAGERLDAPTRLVVVRGLGTVAPAEDRATRETLRALLEAGETREVGVAIVKVLMGMGDRRAREVLFESLEAKLRERRNNVNLLEDRAYAWFAFEQYAKAIDDYQQAIRFSSSRARTSVFYLKIARCFAHLNRVGSMLEAIADAAVTLEEVEREAAEDPVFAEALANPRTRQRLEGIVRK